MMIRKILLAIVFLFFVPTFVMANGLTIWGLTENKVGLDENALIGRIGYQYEFIEAFVGSTWRPNYNVDDDEIDPPQVLSMGAILHTDDIIDPNSPIPWIPDLLLTFIPKDFVAQPYIGTQATYNLYNHDAGFYGGLAGILMKTKKESKSAFVAEAAYNKNFGDLDAVPDEWRLNLGMRFYFD